MQWGCIATSSGPRVCSRRPSWAGGCRRRCGLGSTRGGPSTDGTQSGSRCVCDEVSTDLRVKPGVGEHDHGTGAHDCWARWRRTILRIDNPGWKWTRFWAMVLLFTRWVACAYARWRRKEEVCGAFVLISIPTPVRVGLAVAKKHGSGRARSVFRPIVFAGGGVLSSLRSFDFTRLRQSRCHGCLQGDGAQGAWDRCP